MTLNQTRTKTTKPMPTLSTKWDQAHSAENLEVIEQSLSQSAEQENIEPVTHEVVSTQLHYGRESRVKGELKTAQSYYSLALEMLVAGPSERIRNSETQKLGESANEGGSENLVLKALGKYRILKELLALVVPNVDDINKTQQRSAELLRQLKELDEQVKQNTSNLNIATEMYQEAMSVAAKVSSMVGDKENIGAKESINFIREHINRYGDELSALELSQQLLDLKVPIRFEMPCMLIPKLYGLSEATVARALGIPTSTFNRNKAKDVQKIVPEELAEKIILFIQLLERGSTIFTSKKLMALWLTTPNEVFDMKKPVDSMQTIGQRIEAIRLLEQFNANSYR